jgi:hypothetical protein
MELQADIITRTSLLPSLSRATNNAVSTGVDISQYVGQLAVVVDIGLLTAGDNNSTFVVQLQDSATNNGQNAANISGATFNSGAAGNNNSTGGVITINQRAQNQFLFARVIITGGNSPAAPSSAQLIGTKRIQ